MKQEVNQYIRYGLILLLAVLTFLILKPYLTVIALALILAYMCFPIQKRLRAVLKNDTVSAGILTGVIFLVIIIPLIFLANTLFHEAATLYTTTNIEDIKELFSTTLNIPISENVQHYINSATKTASSYILTKISSYIFSVPSLIMNFFIMLFIIFFALRDGEKILATSINLIPIEEHYKKRFQKKLTSTIESLFYGTIALAALEGVIAIIGFYFLGVDAPILWGFVISLTAIIPGIGATIVWVPMALIAFLQGNTTTALLLALFGFLILSTLIDTFLRAKILGMRAQIHPAIIVIGVLGGLSAFGLIGVLLGPLILSLFELTIEIYTEIRHEAQSERN